MVRIGRQRIVADLGPDAKIASVVLVETMLDPVVPVRTGARERAAKRSMNAVTSPAVM